MEGWEGLQSHSLYKILSIDSRVVLLIAKNTSTCMLPSSASRFLVLGLELNGSAKFLRTVRCIPRRVLRFHVYSLPTPPSTEHVHNGGRGLYGVQVSSGSRVQVRCVPKPPLCSVVCGTDACFRTGSGYGLITSSAHTCYRAPALTTQNAAGGRHR